MARNARGFPIAIDPMNPKFKNITIKELSRLNDVDISGALHASGDSTAVFSNFTVNGILAVSDSGSANLKHVSIYAPGSGNPSYTLPSTFPVWGDAGPQFLSSSGDGPTMAWTDFDHVQIKNHGTTTHADLDLMYAKVDQAVLTTSDVHFNSLGVVGAITPGSVSTGNVQTGGIDHTDEDGKDTFTSKVQTGVDGSKTLKIWNKVGDDVSISLKKADGVSDVLIKAGDATSFGMTQVGAASSMVVRASQMSVAVDSMKLAYNSVELGNTIMEMTKRNKGGSEATIIIQSEDNPDGAWKLGTLATVDDEFKLLAKTPDAGFTEMMSFRPASETSPPYTLSLPINSVDVGPRLSVGEVGSQSLDFTAVIDIAADAAPSGRGQLRFKRKATTDLNYVIGMDDADVVDDLLIAPAGGIGMKMNSDGNVTFRNNLFIDGLINTAGAQGDLLVGAPAGANMQALAIGADGAVLTSNGTTCSWVVPSAPSVTRTVLFSYGNDTTGVDGGHYYAVNGNPDSVSFGFYVDGLKAFMTPFDGRIISVSIASDGCGTDTDFQVGFSNDDTSGTVGFNITTSNHCDVVPVDFGVTIAKNSHVYLDWQGSGTNPGKLNAQVLFQSYP